MGEEGSHMHGKLFSLAAARNYMLAYHKETVYHSINIGTALIVNGVISIQHHAEMKNVGGINIPVRSAHLLQSRTQDTSVHFTRVSPRFVVLG